MHNLNCGNKDVLMMCDAWFLSRNKVGSLREIQTGRKKCSILLMTSQHTKKFSESTIHHQSEFVRLALYSCDWHHNKRRKSSCVDPDFDTCFKHNIGRVYWWWHDSLSMYYIDKKSCQIRISNFMHVDHKAGSDIDPPKL